MGFQRLQERQDSSLDRDLNYAIIDIQRRDKVNFLRCPLEQCRYVTVIVGAWSNSVVFPGAFYSLFISELKYVFRSGGWVSEPGSDTVECLTVRTESGVNFANLMSVRLNCFRKWVWYPSAVPSWTESSRYTCLPLLLFRCICVEKIKLRFATEFRSIMMCAGSFLWFTCANKKH